MLRFGKNQFTRIKNPQGDYKLRGDFRFNIYSFLIMLLIFSIGAVISVLTSEIDVIARGAVGLILSALLYTFFPYWLTLIPAFLFVQLAFFLDPGSLSLPFPETLLLIDLSLGKLLCLAGTLIALFFGPSLQLALQWEKTVVLRIGKFKKVHGPGLFFLFPILDRCVTFVDTRIRATDFSAEKVLTRDTVPVHVDALAFWLIWDPQRAILEVENFIDAVTLSAQTALRGSIGKYSLTTLLTERETLYQEIQSILDAKTNPWGITILSVEFTDIILPQELEGVMSKQAQAEREKEARFQLAEAEHNIAQQFSETAEIYRKNPEALNLRAMNMIYDSMKNRGSLVLLPSTALDQMNLGSILGVHNLAKNANTTSKPAAAEEEEKEQGLQEENKKEKS